MNTTPDEESNGRGHIVVVGQWREGHTRVPIPYAHSVALAGGRPEVFSTFKLLPDEEPPDDFAIHVGLDPFDTSPMEGATGLVIPGGGDLDPQWYGHERHPRTRNVNHRRDRFEITLLTEALERDIPVLAICHGMQLLNVHLGGTLDQHLADSPQRLDHDRDMPRSEPAHEIRIKERSSIAKILGGSRAGVNSHHHQGLDVVADELEETAWAEDGVLEAVVMTNRTWVIGVQWHPEVMTPIDHKQLNLFEAFVEATKLYEASGAASKARTA